MRRSNATAKGETQDQPHNRPVPTGMDGMTLHVEGSRWQRDPLYPLSSLPAPF